MKCGQIVKVKYHLPIDTKNFVCAIEHFFTLFWFGGKGLSRTTLPFLRQQKINTHRLLYFFPKMKMIHLALRHFVFSSTVQVPKEADGDTRPKVQGPHVIHQL